MLLASGFLHKEKKNQTEIILGYAPILGGKICKRWQVEITLTEAEKDLGVDQIDEICEKSTRYTYELKTHP